VGLEPDRYSKYSALHACTAGLDTTRYRSVRHSETPSSAFLSPLAIAHWAHRSIAAAALAPAELLTFFCFCGSFTVSCVAAPQPVALLSTGTQPLCRLPFRPHGANSLRSGYLAPEHLGCQPTFTSSNNHHECIHTLQR
jgi:hypothetical protein